MSKKIKITITKTELTESVQLNVAREEAKRAMFYAKELLAELEAVNNDLETRFYDYEKKMFPELRLGLKTSLERLVIQTNKASNQLLKLV